MASVRNLSQNLPLQFNEKVWNQIKGSIQSGNEKKTPYCYIPLCIGYQTTMPAAELAALVKSIEKEGYGYTLILCPREKKDDETISPLEAWEADNADVLANIREHHGEDKIYTEKSWRETERWQAAKKAFEKFYDVEETIALKQKLLEADVQANSKKGQKGDAQQIKAHCVDCAIDYISFSGPKEGNTLLPILIYKNSFSQIMHNVSQNIEHMEYDKVLRIKPNFTVAANEAKTNPTVNEAQKNSGESITASHYAETMKPLLIQFAKNQVVAPEYLSALINNVYSRQQLQETYIDEVVYTFGTLFAMQGIDPAYWAIVMEGICKPANPAPAPNFNSESQYNKPISTNSFTLFRETNNRAIAVGDNEKESTHRRKYG